jgi:OOP family OmpA-OmpF porin
MRKLIVILLLSSGYAFGDDSGFYVGAGASIYGASVSNSDNITTTGGDSLTFAQSAGGFGMRLFGGYNFNRYFGVEGGYASNVGVGSGLIIANPATLGMTTGDIEAVGYLPIFATNIKFLGKLGAGYNSASYSYNPTWLSSQSVTEYGSGIGLVLGAGVEWDIINTFIVRLEYVNYGNVNIQNVGTYNNADVALNFGYKF